MYKILNKLSYWFAFVGSFILIYERHYYSEGYGKFGWIFLVGIGFVAFNLLKQVKKWCSEIAYIQQGKLSVETPRRPIANSIWQFGIIGVSAWIIKEFFIYIESSSQDLSQTFYYIAIIFIIGLIINLTSIVLKEKRG